jgi:hypothetical protein
MREAPNASLKIEQKTLTGGNWTKILDENVQRTYLMIQNDHDAHTIEVGFGTNTVAPTIGFHIEGAVSGHKIKDTTFEFSVAPINAVWAKADDAHDHPIDVIYDD